MTKAHFTTTLANLIDDGKLEVGTALVIRRRNKPDIGAELVATGLIQLPEGDLFFSPSNAARSALGVKAVNGWATWRRASDDQTLAEIRAGSQPSGATVNRLAAQSIGDREAKVDRLTALKAENAAVKAWEAAGSTGERPPTPLHDAAAEKAPRPNPARTTAAKKATTGRVRQIRKAVKA